MLYFIRHGESVANVRNLFAGQLDNTPLTEAGKRQATAAGQRIKSSNVRIDLIVTSPLVRARQTAELIRTAIGLPLEKIIEDTGIAEYDMGDLTSTPRKNITSKQLISAPHAEDPIAFMNRVMSVITRLRARQGNILVVSHAGVGRIIEANRQGMPAADFYDLASYPNAELVKL
ncbi:MAG TPA: histidine phosphatase family protein [Patescibacteria group bacterium]|nr:histidine phosphatase family protein [Patescibacteria group bacterium]